MPSDSDLENDNKNISMTDKSELDIVNYDLSNINNKFKKPWMLDVATSWQNMNNLKLFRSKLFT